MGLCRCEKPKNSKWNGTPVCRSCYKKLWAKANQKTNTEIKYRQEFDQYVETIAKMAPICSISDIEKATGLYHKAIVCIAKKHNIVFPRKGKSSKTTEREKVFLELLQAGHTINSAKTEVNFNPKKANELAASIGIFPKKKDERYKIGLEEAQNRVKDYMKVNKQIRKNNRRCFEVVCSKCGETAIKETFYLNTGCLNCEKPTHTQNEIAEWIKSFGLEIVQNKRLKNNKQIDIFIPSLNLGIEYCGLHWHTEESGRSRTYHIDKMKEANSEGIRLITIFEDEWLERQNQVKNFLLSVMNKNQYKIHGRNTVVKVADKDTANKFYEDNHIQGKPSTTTLHVGLYTQDGTMVGCMSFGPHHRGSENRVVVLNRLAFLHNHTVHGGASKLLSFAISLLRPMGYEKIMSWSDNRWSEGKVYGALGFYLEEELGPDYSYVKDRQRISKQSCQKKHLLKKGAVGDTELEMAKSLGYSRIWDCGKKRWVLDI
jgi:formylmethanofuran dehydrogenase subunit E